MIESIATDNRTAVMGLGLTGLSCARYLHARKLSFCAFDKRLSEDAETAFRKEFPDALLYVGEFDGEQLSGFTTLLVSPGISLNHPAIARALAAGSVVSSDIDILMDEIDSPVVTITGSNGKSTVTSLVGEMAVAAGMSPAVAGNIGKPVLDFVDRKDGYDLFVLELSSFQLERCDRLESQVSALLNVSPDHMDRYSSLMEYQQTKQRIFRRSECAVYNRGDKLTQPLMVQGLRARTFGLDAPDLEHYGLLEQDGELHFARGPKALMPVADMKLHGSHNHLNALAALAIGEEAGLPMAAMLDTIRNFCGLSHRCQWLAEHRDVAFFNDSKGTNTGATIAAVKGLSRKPADIVLIAGGVGKGADFTPLAGIASRLKAVVLIGEAAADIAAVFSPSVSIELAGDMAAAVSAAAAIASKGDIVLLSPACASFDMFDDYQHRGRVFSRLVGDLVGGVQ